MGNIVKIDWYIFNSDCTALVNTVNCEWYMWKWLALEFKFRFPEMYKSYEKECIMNNLKPWMLHYWKWEKTPYIINFPTKFKYRENSSINYIRDWLKYFLETYKEYPQIESIAFPLLWTSLWWLPEDLVLDCMYEYLWKCDIPKIEIYKYNEKTTDLLFQKLKDSLWTLMLPEIGWISNKKLVDITNEIRNNPYIKHISDLWLYWVWVWEETITKLYQYALKL